ncbi:phage tail protein [Sphingomonas sp. Leaf4]|uniref:phage tail protein n=1 Tax=Sphingomonas sp. Leaf4 TaxID=2876553 RepID=UPI001E5A1622|nr:tail fiber protein [Sphingomonas sp. Leaf4]
MSDPFVGEVRLFGGNFAPVNWAFCNGALLSISEYEVLYTLIGTTYGGDGATTFGLPNLAGRVPVGQGAGPALTPRTIGQSAGEEQHTLTSLELATHTHGVVATTAAGSLTGPTGDAITAAPTGGTAKNSMYVTQGTSTMVPAAMSATSVGVSGGNQPHDNMMPTVCVSYIICLNGIYPTQN